MRKNWIGAAAVGCALIVSTAYWRSASQETDEATASTVTNWAPVAPTPGDRRATTRSDRTATAAATTQSTPAFSFRSPPVYRAISSVLGPDARVSAVAVGDVTGDGRDDLVVTSHIYNQKSPSAGKVLVYPQQADGTLAQPIKLHNGWDSGSSSDQGLALADMNNDGLLDIVYSNGYVVDAAISKGAGQFTWFSSGTYSYANYPTLGVLDIDRNGWPDVFAQTFSSGADLLTGFASRPLWDRQHLVTPVSDYSVLRVGDVTGDGLPDVVLSHRSSNETSVYPALPQGGLGPRRAYRTPSSVSTSVAIGDFDNDGRNDIAISGQADTRDVYIFRQNANGELDAAVRTNSQRVAESLWAADFDRDGKTDLIGVHNTDYAGLSLYLQGEQGLQPQQMIADGSMFYDTVSTPLGSGDLDGDGCTDLAIAAVGSVIVHRGQNCKPPRPRPVARDLDGDRKSDLIWRHSLGYLATWTMDGATRVDGVSYTVGPEWRVVASGDYNGDGRTDMIWTDGSSMQMWRNDGNGAYVGLPMQAYPRGYRAVASADINGDGKADVIWQDDSDYYLSSWIMNGAVTISGHASKLSSSCWIVLGSGDFDGNGRADLLLGNDMDLEMHFGQSDGSLFKSSFSAGSYPRGWSLAGVGDADGDGRSDLFWRYNGTGYFVLWRMLGKYRAAGYSYSVGNDWRVIDVADHDGDGRSDLVWTDGKSMQRWKSKGDGTFSGEVMTDYPTGWSLIATEGAGRRRCPAP